ncbi:ferrous iron transport protein B [Clostridium botulinum]|uniref:Ferrous iron transport protein B n=1 Tax=Clostridium botulinum (strain Eklund 17B / Type B) TaxID=935198 RepID=B2TI81_CLOBB|nr:ferrous iron transport protein B [Clostridium sp. ZBS18]ACD23203.1 ferrous iron transport protein B [Clostridium botulinum B str. Eklund 17B (NRP)]MBN1055324.1 ferrous iron transport protein B [Clostridium botulinum]MBY6977258.1 ferrous iron transport protein B [Clostridium botulinum]MBY6999415.1 ferrous iron transport protein B [Clostridium botulinum]MCR1272500.1 ferrous iron transport protein B [Clostridium botulinum]
MGLTNQSTGTNALDKDLNIVRISKDDKVIALAGNPNVGKSTVFNNLTGLNQHTGNWPGKTVTNATGKYIHNKKDFILVDIPGTYSLMANSVEEEVARDFICFGNPDATVVIVDATCLERNLNLVLQTLEITENVLVCVNLMNEAKRKGIVINLEKLSSLLGVPVVGTSANIGKGLKELKDEIYNLSFNSINKNTISIKYNSFIEESILLIEKSLPDNLKDKINTRWLSLKLLEGDLTLLSSIDNYIGFNLLDDTGISKAIYNAKEYLKINGLDENMLRDDIVTTLVRIAEKVSKDVVAFSLEKYNDFDRKIDKVLTSKKFGIPIMILLLAIIFWITITGANIPSEMLATGLFWIQDKLSAFLFSLGAPVWLDGVLIQGVYRTLAWVVSVMLPPMAIFFPLFTLLEDLGYLPRIAYNLDNFFKKSCACGKQALTMCMGFGCNAAGIIGCRIIDSPRERLIAIITNNFVPCNGRFPTLIAIITMFFAGMFVGPFQSIASTLILTCVILLGVFMTLTISKILSKTILKGIPSSFTLELPPYRKPQVGKIIVRSIFDRTLFVLGRAIVVAAPAGLVIWLMANLNVNGLSILTHCANFLNPFAHLIGLDGYILMAFILGFPANEIVIPIIIMSYMATGSIIELSSTAQLHSLLVENGWTWLTAVCVMLFSLMHWPCSTTCLTIKKETQSLKWTAISFLVPTITGITICFIVTSIVRLLGLA